MGKKKKHKKSGNENKTLETIVFITAILNLIDGLISIIKDLFQDNEGRWQLPSASYYNNRT